MNDEVFNVVMEFEGVENRETKEKLAELFAKAYNEVYTKEAEKALDIMNELWKTEYPNREKDSAFVRFIVDGLTCITEDMNKTFYGSVFSFYIHPESAMLEANVRFIPNSKVSFHMVRES